MKIKNLGFAICILMALAPFGAFGSESRILIHPDADPVKTDLLRKEIIDYLSENGLKIPVQVVPETGTGDYCHNIMVFEMEGTVLLNIDTAGQEGDGYYSLSMTVIKSAYADDCRVLLRSILPIALSNVELANRKSAQQGDAPEPATNAIPASRPPSAPAR